MEQHSQIPAVDTADPADFVLFLLLNEDEPKDLLILGRQGFENAVNMALSFLRL